MNNFITRTLPGLSVGIMLLLLLSTSVSVPTVSADTVSDKAAAACKSQSSTKDSKNNSAKSACIAGFKDGYNKKSDKVCSKLKSHKADCASGYSKGKAAAPNSASKASGSGSSVTQASDSCGEKSQYCADPAVAASAKCNQDDGCDLIARYVNPAINMLSGLVGLAVVISIIIGGIQYSASEGDPQKASKAKTRITNALFALVVFLFMYAFLQFLVPGGVFRGP